MDIAIRKFDVKGSAFDYFGAYNDERVALDTKNIIVNLGPYNNIFAVGTSEKLDKFECWLVSHGHRFMKLIGSTDLEVWEIDEIAKRHKIFESTFENEINIIREVSM